MAQASAELATDALAARNTFKKHALAHFDDATWREVNGVVVDGVSAQARYSDIVILGQDEWLDPPERHPLPLAHSIVMRCGRPVLVVPAGERGAHFTKVALAWDGSREAVRAIHDALPMLRLAHAVDLLSVVTSPDRDGENDRLSLVAHLAHHGVALEAKTVSASAAEEHAMLRSSIDQGDYDLLVMGAYSHARWVEFLFGGATQSALLTSNIPVLVSH